MSSIKQAWDNLSDFHKTIIALITNVISIVTLVVGFLGDFRGAPHTYIVCGGVLLSAPTFIWCMYTLFQRRPSDFNPSVKVNSPHRPLALVGAITFGALYLFSFFYPPARTFITDALRGTSTPSPLAFPTATPDEILLIISDFDNRSGGTVNVDPAQRIYNFVTTRLPSDAQLRVEQLHTPIKDTKEARQALQTYGATILIWGWLDQIGAQAHVEVDQDRIELENPDLPELSLTTPDSIVIRFTEEIPAQVGYTSLLALGIMQYHSGVNDGAVELLSEAVRSARVTSPGAVNPWEALAWRATIYIVTGEYDLALADYNEALNLHDFSIGHHNRGIVYYKQGKYDEAVADYTEAIRLDPNLAYAYNSRGVAFDRQGKYAQAIADFTEAIRLDPNYADAYNNRGGIYVTQGEFDKGIADFTEAIRIDPNFAHAYNNRGAVFAGQSKYPEAIADYTEAIRLDPYYAYYYNRGNTYFTQGKYAEAIADYNEAIRRDPTHAMIYYYRGNAYVAQGKYTEAIADYTEAIRIEPTFAAYNDRGSTYAMQGKYIEAIADFTEAIRIDPTVAAVYCNLGMAYSQTGDFPAAVAALEKGMQLSAMPWCQTALDNARNGTPTP